MTVSQFDWSKTGYKTCVLDEIRIVYTYAALRRMDERAIESV